MRLINPGAGDYADRLTILTLKLLFGEAAGKETTHFRNERNVLITKLAGRELTSAAMEALLDLAVVNAALWHAEDDLRHARPTDPREGINAVLVADLAIRIQELNDQRATLRQTINKELGDHLGEEKLT